LLEVRRSLPAIAHAYDLKEMFYRIYDDPDAESAKHAFEAWENALPDQGLEDFKKLAKTVRNHYDDIFMYWNSPVRITNAYTECLNGLTKIANRMGRGYSYDIIRAKVLYAKYARKVGSGVRVASISGIQQTVEYGPHIPTLVESAEAGEMD